MTFEKQSNGRRIEVDRSCIHCLRPILTFQSHNCCTKMTYVMHIYDRHCARIHEDLCALQVRFDHHGTRRSATANNNDETYKLYTMQNC